MKNVLVQDGMNHYPVQQFRWQVKVLAKQFMMLDKAKDLVRTDFFLANGIVKEL